MNVYDEPLAPPQQQKLLLVEDYLESGKSMHHVAGLLRKNDNDVKTVALGYLAKTILVPTYSLGQVDVIPRMPGE